MKEMMLANVVGPTAIVPFRSVESEKPIELYDYQKRLKSELYSHIRANIQRILLVAPPGSGKTLLAADILRDATERAKTIRKCVFLVDLNCLLDQTAEELSRLGLKCTVLQGRRGFDRNASIIVASCQTLEARIKSGISVRDVLGNASLLFNDEAHDTAYRRVYAQLQEEFLPSGAVFVGMTGTPWRMSRRQCMGDWYDAVCVAPQPPELVRMGRLVICRPFTINGVLDSSQLDISSTGDYIESQMQKQATSDSALKTVVDNWVRLASTSGADGQHRPTIAYCSGVEHALLLSERFNQEGIQSDYQVGATPFEKRKAQWQDLNNGKLKVVCTVGTATKGFNLPIVSCILFVRATRSKSLYMQAAQRGGRTYPGKNDYLLLDFGQNVKRFAVPTAYQDYDSCLELRPFTQPTESTKPCPKCGAVISVFSKICPECGHEFEPDADDGEQVDLEFDLELKEYFDPIAKQQCSALRTWKKQAYKEDLSPDTATTKFSKIYGFVPPSDWHFAACLTRRYSDERKEEFIAYLKRHAPHNYWLKAQLRLEFGFELENGNHFDRTPEIFTAQMKWWEVLGVDVNATKAECKEAYRALALQYHPDVCGLDNAKENMALINRAWEKAKASFTL